MEDAPNHTSGKKVKTICTNNSCDNNKKGFDAITYRADKHNRYVKSAEKHHRKTNDKSTVFFLV